MWSPVGVSEGLDLGLKCQGGEKILSSGSEHQDFGSLKLLVLAPKKALKNGTQAVQEGFKGSVKRELKKVDHGERMKPF